MHYLMAALLMVSLTGCSKSVRKDVGAYFAAVCEKEGFAKGTEENDGCVRVKATQVQPVRSGGGGVFIPPKSSIQCQQVGNTTRCY